MDHTFCCLSLVVALPAAAPRLRLNSHFKSIGAWFASALLIVAGAAPALTAQAANRIAAKVDSAQILALPNHHPQWAVAQNSIGPATSNLSLTMVLSRTPQQEAALQQLMADQQNPSSPDYHHWLTPAEFGERFGLSESDIAAVTGWLQAQGLNVDWVAPSRAFIGFSGKATNVGRAFQTQINRYSVNGLERISVATDPILPAALTPAIKSIRGLYTIDEQPLHHAETVQAASPQLTANDGSHFITPADFYFIYHLGCCGDGVTIGIVGWSRVNTADLDNFRLRTGIKFHNPTEVVPTAYGGVDPGPAFTAPPGGNISTSAQAEATLDVTRAGGVARNANLLLVAATSASGGIEADAQYLVQTTPLPAQVMSISFGACESSAGPVGVTFWDTLFQQAAAEGISTFVASGDSGASGCDANFSPPPASPQPNSPNYICSSSYATCVGGTEFNDAINPSLYWRTTNNAELESAIGYIPEGGWNEPLNGALTQVASSGGGVSSIIPTPSWQKGTAGVPTAYSGRYTPDVSFSASCHDGYFECFAAGGNGQASCVPDSTGVFYFASFCGTSASAPGMAGIAALLDQSIGAAQGNLSPQLYQLAASTPAVFHDATPETSGVGVCDVNTPSMCNNSIPGVASLSGGQAGFPLTTGFDQVTGLGSLDVGLLLNNWTAPPTIKPLLDPPLTMTWPSQIVGYSATGVIDIQNSGSTTLNPLTITITGTNASDFSQTNNCLVSLDSRTICVANLTFTPTAAGTRTATLSITSSNASNSPVAVALSGIGSTTPLVPPISVSAQPHAMTTVTTLTVQASVNQAAGYPMPTGSAIMTAGNYTSASATLNNGQATFTVAPGTFPIGSYIATVAYTPDVASSKIYSSATSGDVFTVSAPVKTTPYMQINPYTFALTPYLPASATVTISSTQGNPTPTGSITLASGSYTSAPVAMSSGSATINIPAGTLPVGNNSVTATYTPDAASSSLYNSVSGSVTMAVTKVTPAVIVSPTLLTITTAQSLPVKIVLNGQSGGPAITGTVILTSGSYTSTPAAVVSGSANITIPAGALAVGYDSLNTFFTPDSTGSVNYNSASGSYGVQVDAAVKLTPTVTATPSSPSVAIGQAFTVTVNVNGGSGNPTPSGGVNLSGGLDSGGMLNNGTVTVSFPTGLTQAGTYTITATYGGDGYYNSATGFGSLTVTTVPPSFTVVGTSLTVARGQSSNNSSAVTVTPAGGFTGPVALTASITSSPTGALYPPTLSFGSTTPVTISSANPGTATLTVTTTAATSGALASPPRPGARWYTTGGAVLASILLFCIPLRRRRFQSILGALLLLVAVTCAISACSGGSVSSTSGGGGGGGGNPGTTSGNYTVSITGAAGSQTATTTFVLTVQ